MKNIKFLLVAVCLTAFLCLTGFNKEQGFNIEVGKNYSFCYSADEKTEIAQKLGMADEEINEFLEKNNVKFLAVNEDNTKQIRVSVYEDDFSENVTSFSDLKTKELTEIANKMVENTNLNYSICSQNAINYIKLFETLSDSGGTYTATQFITVADKKVFNITFYNNGNDINKEFLNVLDTFSINDETYSSKRPAIFAILISVAIAGFITLIVAMIIGIIRDKSKLKQEEKDKSENSK